ncbi:RagB/SusD family nutrient uptake outer membrane protein [Nonlabens sp. Asnod2-A12]|uniref:RagB/SusD family nutrient uptake outer membrane protein n=1 Tax=Nonlabens sp. Asnod2-A12 TaxID=3160578 RepID=UPI00387095B9
MKKIVILIAAVAMTFSCEDATDIVQPGELGAANAFITVEDLKTGTSGVYLSGVSSTEISFTSQFTDEAAVGLVGQQGSALHGYTLNPSTGIVSSIWLNNYNLILRANVLLAAAENIVPADAAEQALYDESVAEALALRALGHSKLLSFFAEDLADNNSLGVIALDFVPNPLDNFGRNTVGEVLTLINDDLDRAEALFTSAGTNASQIFIDAKFVRALRARMALYNKDYPAAAAAANSVLADYSFPTTADLAAHRRIWQDDPSSGSNEIIFKFVSTLNNGSRPGQIFNTNESDFDGAVNYEMSRNLFDVLDANATAFGDIRRDIYIDITSVVSPDYNAEANPRTGDVLVVDKYPGNPAIAGLVGGYTNDIKVIRVAEMYFILAEEAASRGDFITAAQQIKIIRDARYTTPAPAPVYASQTEAFSDILAERKIEFFAEGHRYIDVRRIGDLAGEGYDRNEIDCSLYPSAECDLSFNDFRVQALPIPQDETRTNTVIAAQQNSGY